MFAGAFFDGDEAARWRDTGLGSSREQLAEQVLADGGHFERSPMYHSIMVEDLLDLVALSRCFPGLLPEATVERWRATIAAMLGWLEVMTHPDGDIAFFNDAALGIAASPAVLRSLAQGLGIEPAQSAAGVDGLTRLDPSGYVRMAAGDFVVLADVAPIGPDYIPGHAHADTLSFELSWRGRRVLGNSGTSCYGTGPQRQRERGTAAHNTVAVDDADSSEVWHGFRVARRARPMGVEAAARDGQLVAACAHDGYTRLPGRPVHRRQWRLGPSGLQVRDEIAGSGEHRATGFLHVQPGIAVTRAGERAFDLDVPDAGRLRLTVEAPASVELVDGFVGPEFGKLVPRPVVRWHLAGPLPLAPSPRSCPRAEAVHILFLTDNFPPETNAPATRTHEHTKRWVRAGHEVTVITGVPNFPSGKVHAGYRNQPWQQETMDGVRVIRVWTYITANEGFLKRTLDYLSFMVTGGLAGLFVKRPDVIVATSPQFFNALGGCLLVDRPPPAVRVRAARPVAGLDLGGGRHAGGGRASASCAASSTGCTAGPRGS